MIRILRQCDPDFGEAVTALRETLRAGGLVASAEGELNVSEAVRQIIDDVAARGDEALIEWEKKLDRAELTSRTLRVSPEQITAAHSAAEPEFLQLIRRTQENIREYQQHIRIQPPAPLQRGSRQLAVRYTPIDRVGVYVPGGRAIYPSTVLMTVVPAQAAGVGEIVLASPPTTDGDIHPMVLALAGELGITEVYRLGGAVAIAALAMGTTSVPAVRKIVGPGNAFVAEAKRQVLGRVGIDSIAGPSEVLIIADKTVRADWLAADLLAQAEHDPGSAILVTTCEALAEEVTAAAEALLGELDRAKAIRSALRSYSAIIVVDDLDAACEIANDFAAEHLQIITADDDATLAKITNAGAIFLGPYTPVPLGDYYAGPSHVLPTGGTAKFFSPLSVNDFLKASSVIKYDRESLSADADDVIDFATREGLTAHAKAVKMRIKQDE
jgi:histidinol dehydrogenase